MHLYIRWTRKGQPTDADKTIQIFAAITVFRAFAPLRQMIVYAENHLVHGRNSSRNSRNQAAKLSFTALLTLSSGESLFKGTATVRRSLKSKRRHDDERTTYL